MSIRLFTFRRVVSWRRIDAYPIVMMLPDWREMRWLPGLQASGKSAEQFSARGTNIPRAGFSRGVNITDAEVAD
jgi:hypothetical protein